MDLPKSKRGAFQPRGDLQNRSPEDEENNACDDDEQEQLKSSSSHPNTLSLPPSNKCKNTAATGMKKKKANYLPVKSSGYGRASNSSSNSRPKLRHGDGSLAGELSFDSKKKTRRSSTSRPSLLLAAHTTATNNKVNNSGKSRARSASPAVKGVASAPAPVETAPS